MALGHQRVQRFPAQSGIHGLDFTGPSNFGFYLSRKVLTDKETASCHLVVKWVKGREVSSQMQRGA